MADGIETSTIQARIAALNVGHVGRAPITAKPSNWNGRLEERPSLDQRSHSTAALQTNGLNDSLSNGIGNEPNISKTSGVLPPPTNIIRTGQKVSKPAPVPPPRLPARKQPSQPSPALPPRRTSDQLSRKTSNESISSTISNISTMSNGVGRPAATRIPSMDAGRIRAPVFDPATLPPLPPKRTKEDVENRYKDIEKSKAFPGYKDVEKRRISLTATKSSPSVTTVEIPPPAMPALPPRRPSRPEPVDHPKQISGDQPPPKPARSALSYGMNKPDVAPITNGIDKKQQPTSIPPKPGVPPPIPLGSRPDLSKAMATKPKAQPQPSVSQAPCLICRDFSAPDAHAAKFPRQSVPSLDWLATQLTAPFPSPTDQARCIFTWLHHNVEYDVVSFFNNTVQPSTPINTLQTGLAVCEGYAGLFTALASKAGLESIVVSGHGKGFGFTASLAPGTPMPSENSNHAWNAVKIDNGYWKTIDSCWGAGNISGAGQPYNKQFTPKMFTMSNDDFSLRHFPTNRSHTFHSDGCALSWEEYMLGDTGGEPLQVYTLADKEGIAETSFLPKYKKIPISSTAHPGPTIRFQFSLVCEHWDPIRNGPGKPFVYILAIHGIDGREDDFVPFESNGMHWWADVEPRRLGARGQTISAYTVDTVSGVTGRGLSVEEYRSVKGRKAMGFGGLAMWELI